MISDAERNARLLRRTLRAAQPKPVYDLELLKAYTAENKVEEEALADSGSAHRLELLEAEDRA